MFQFCFLGLALNLISRQLQQSLTTNVQDMYICAAWPLFQSTHSNILNFLLF